MVKKLKAMAEAKSDNQLATAVRESAQQIWLAGLGAFSKAQEEGGKVFSALVREGVGLQKRTRSAAIDRVEAVSGRVTKAADELSKQASDSWDKLEQVFEERVERSLKRLGVPTDRDIQHLIERVDELSASVRGGAAGAAKRAPAKKAAATRSTAKKSTVTKPTPAKSAAATAARKTSKPRKAAATARASDQAAAGKRAARKAATKTTTGGSSAGD